MTVNGQRREISISLKINPEKWNSIAERSIEDSREDQELNFRLDTIRMRIMQIYREMEFDKIEISAKTFEAIAMLSKLENFARRMEVLCYHSRKKNLTGCLYSQDVCLF